MRGAAVACRIVAIVLCLWASKRSLHALRRARERRRRIRTRKPWPPTVPRRGAPRPAGRRKRSSMWAWTDRLRELIDVVLASLDEPADGASLARRGALLARPPGPAAGGGDGRVAGGAAAAAAARAGGVAAAHGRGLGVRGAPRAPATARWRRSRARSRAPTARRRARSTARSQLAAPNGIHFHPPAGLLIPGARAVARRDLTDRMVSHHLDRVRELLAAAATLPPEALERAAAARASSPSGSRARRRARR